MFEANRNAAVEIDGRNVAIAVRRSRRARRLSLRVDPALDDVELVLPRGVSLAEGLDFVRSRAGWVARRLAALPPRAAFADGVDLPVLDARLTVRHWPEASGASRRDGATLVVGGRPEHVARRVRDWLKREARLVLGEEARTLARIVGRPIRRIRLGDPRSRWGSCSAEGGLAFSWRLIMAPAPVLRYVVAHEVAHLVELNHSRRFWWIVERLVGDSAGSRAWLKREGARLLRLG